MPPIQNKAMIKAVTIFLLLMAGVLAIYIFAQSSSQVAKGKEVVKQKSTALACTGLVFSLKGIEQGSDGLSLTIRNEGYSNGRIESATIKSGGVSRKEDLNIDPGIEKRLKLDNFRMVGNFTVEVTDCEDYAKVCTESGCRAKI